MGILVSLALIGMLGLFVRLYKTFVLKPKRLRSLLEKQGIDGPTPSFLLGNIKDIKKALSTSPTAHSSKDPHYHNCALALFPFFEQWRKQYGQIFKFALGNTQILYVNQADVVKEIATCTSFDLGKPEYQRKEHGPLLGQGILTSNGASWAHQRKILAPQLYLDKVKSMMDLVTESAISLLVTWKRRCELTSGGIAEIKIDEYIRSFSGDVISRACFGSNYNRGKDIFSRLRALQEASSKKSLSIGIPGMRYLPTKRNRETWALEKEVRSLILEVVKERKEREHENDLLQMVLEAAENSDFSQKDDRFIVDNCKNIYLAGYETTAVAATWCLMLLAVNPEWQERVRTEVVEICNGHDPDYDMLRRMKKLTMVIHESLRLYPPVSVVSREAFKNMKFGSLNIPKGVNLWTLVVTAHTDAEIWGPDAHKFNPDRFVNGITGACKHPHMYMPFGVGPRVCLGQNLAMVELKVLVSLILSKFSFTLSPKYNHSPALRLVIEPENGVDLLLKKL